MYNTDIPTRAELPTTRQLLRSTAIAFGAAVVILITIVLPAEYAIDPTGIGKAIGLAEMGEIKTQLAAEAEADRIKDEAQPAPASPTAPDQRSGILGSVIAELFVGSARAQEAAQKSEETKVTLKPGEGAEVKLDMKKGAKANFSWSAEGGVVNFDMHGDGGGSETSYEKGRAAPSQEGVLEAAFDGKHGWFWRNRGKADVTVTLKVTGDFSAMKRVM
jgi:hypothetical protein